MKPDSEKIAKDALSALEPEAPKKGDSAWAEALMDGVLIVEDEAAEPETQATSEQAEPQESAPSRRDLPGNAREPEPAAAENDSPIEGFDRAEAALAAANEVQAPFRSTPVRGPRKRLDSNDPMARAREALEDAEAVRQGPKSIEAEARALVELRRMKAAQEEEEEENKSDDPDIKSSGGRRL